MNLYNSDLEIVINKKKLFYDIYDQSMNKSPFELKKKILYIKYKGKEGIDAEGLLR